MELNNLNCPDIKRYILESLQDSLLKEISSLKETSTQNHLHCNDIKILQDCLRRPNISNGGIWVQWNLEEINQLKKFLSFRKLYPRQSFISLLQILPEPFLKSQLSHTLPVGSKYFFVPCDKKHHTLGLLLWKLFFLKDMPAAYSS